MSWGSHSKISSFPNAILHVDGDAFFASCEQAIHPELQGKPVVTGQERGIVSAASYEAKALGITRGMTLHEVKRNFPQVTFVPSDYETYSLFSKRMFDIMRRYTNKVEEYGIDEGFMDITGMRRPLNMSYPKIAQAVKEEIEKSLDITVSIGLAATKVLAKFGSKYNKPSGLTYIRNKDRVEFLTKKDVLYIWGVGANTAGYMDGLGIKTAYDFAQMPFHKVQQYFGKPQEELWRELNGETVYAVTNQPKQCYASISKTKTFTPPRNDRSFVYAQLVKSLENACVKARRYKLVARKVTVLLKTQEFRIRAVELKLTRSSAYPNELTDVISKAFSQLFEPGVLYRSTGVTLSGLHEDTSIQSTLFEEPVQLEKLKRVYDAVDTVAKKFGKHSVHLGASLHANVFEQHLGKRGDKAWRKSALLRGETTRQRLAIPMVQLK